jgi:hypothetical protein
VAKTLALVLMTTVVVSAAGCGTFSDVMCGPMFEDGPLLYGGVYMDCAMLTACRSRIFARNSTEDDEVPRTVAGAVIASVLFSADLPVSALADTFRVPAVLVARKEFQTNRVAGENSSTVPSYVSATLEVSKAGWVRVTVTNITDEAIRFVDVREGCAMCDQFWCIEVRMENGEKLASVMRYAPGETPYEGTEITLNPGQKYPREFQLDAYVDIPSYVTVYGHNDTTASYRSLRPRTDRIQAVDRSSSLAILLNSNRVAA